MRPPSQWPILVIILLGALILREPRLQPVDDILLSWFMEHSQPLLPPAQVTLVEISRDGLQRIGSPPNESNQPPPGAKGQSVRRSLSPLEYALFLQAVLEFQPPVIALEPIVIWRDREKDQEQIFIDQAMRVPKLLVGVELGGKGEHDLAPDDVLSFAQVTGSRGSLAEFSGVKRQPDEDIRLISTAGFINLPAERSNRVRVPMLFDYRGEIVPSFALQAIMLWLRVTAAEVKVELGSQINLPNGWKIPIHSDGTVTINPVAAQRMRRLTLNQLLLAAQEREANRPPSIELENLKKQIVILRVADDPLQPPNLLATAIATIQNNAYVQPAHWAVGWIIILAAALFSCWLWHFSKANLVLGAVACSAGYCLMALAVLSKDRIWLPTFLPLLLLWFLVVVRLCTPAPALKHEIAATG